jgi:hypothetical protein
MVQESPLHSATGNWTVRKQALAEKFCLPVANLNIVRYIKIGDVENVCSAVGLGCNVTSKTESAFIIKKYYFQIMTVSVNWF